MATLTGLSVKGTYKDLLTISGVTANEGLTGNTKLLYDGAGNASPMKLSQTAIEMLGKLTIGSNDFQGNDGKDFTIYGTDGGSSSTDEPYMAYVAKERKLIINDGNAEIDGDVHCKYLKLINSGFDDGAPTGAIVLDATGQISVLRNLQTKGEVKFSEAGYDDIVMKASTGVMEKGDGTKGKVVLGDTTVTLSKGSTTLITAKEDGTLAITSVDTFPSSPTNGDMVNKDGGLYVAG